MRLTIAAFSSFLLVTSAHANELWRCQLADDLGNEAMRVTFEVRGKKLIQKWEAGIESDYDVAQNNEYGFSRIVFDVGDCTRRNEANSRR